MTIIEQTELIGRELFRQYMIRNNITQFKEMPINCPYDFGIKSGNTFYQCEVKVRNNCSNYLAKYRGPFLELLKLNGMILCKEKIKKEKGIDVENLYFNFSSDGLLIFKLGSVEEYNWENKFLPKGQENLTPKEKRVTELYGAIEEIIW